VSQLLLQVVAMRSAVAFSVLAGAVSSPLLGERDFAGYSFEDYLGEFNKNYAKADYFSRKALFNANLQKIQDHNSNPSKTWFMAVNEFTDLTPEEFKASRLGELHDVDDSNYVGEFSATSLGGVPDSIDWRTTAGVVTPVKNQGACGSCWAFSTVETLESHFAIATGEAAPHFSPQQVTSCTPNPQKCGGSGGCQGNIQTQGFNYTAQAGITTDGTYPYTAGIGIAAPCDQNKIKPCAQNAGFTKLKVNDYASLINAVATQGPVSISVAAQSWQLYGGGILSECDCDMDHAVVLDGYGTDAGKDYWLVRNSWGGSWGEKGYIRVQRFGDGKEPTCVDKTPQDGEACAGDTKPRTYAGLCGLMGSSSIPTGMKKVGECPKAPSGGCPFSDCGECQKYCADKGMMRGCGTDFSGFYCKCGQAQCRASGDVVV